MLALRAAIRSVVRRAFQKVQYINRQAFSDKYLLATNVTISFSLSAIGDILEQRYERYCGEMEKWDRRRTLYMSIAGFNVGVICHYWYLFLDHHLPGHGIRIVMLKIVLDQFVCSPAYISAFFITMGVLHNESAHDIWKELKEKAWKLYLAEWLVWPAAQFINFYYLPTKYRVLYDNILSLGNDVYTSRVKHSEP